MYCYFYKDLKWKQNAILKAFFSFTKYVKYNIHISFHVIYDLIDKFLYRNHIHFCYRNVNITVWKFLDYFNILKIDNSWPVKENFYILRHTCLKTTCQMFCFVDIFCLRLKHFFRTCHSKTTVFVKFCTL